MQIQNNLRATTGNGRVRRNLLAIALLGFLVPCFLLMTVVCKAGFPIGTGTYVTVATNSAVGQTNYATVVLPSIYEGVNSITNQYTAFTNSVVHSFNLNGTQYTIIATAVITNTGNSGTMFTNWSTNWPAQTIVVPVYTYFQVAPQLGSNTFNVQTY